jgi:YVTN family beta-propeller protein
MTVSAPVVLALCFGWMTTGLGAQSLLVVNQGDSDVYIVDPVAGRQVAKIAEGIVGIHGHEIAVSKDGKTAYLPIYGSSGVGKPGLSGHEMQVIDLLSRTIIGNVDFGHEVRPHYPILDPVSGLLYVTTELDNSVTIIDPKTLKIVGSIPTGQAESHMLVLSHDGKWGYTANVGPGTISILDLKARKTAAVFPVVEGAAGSKAWRIQRIAISNDDTLLFTADQVKPQMAVVDIVTRKVRNWVALPGMGYGSAVSQDGRWLLVAVPDVNQLAVIDLTSMTVIRTLDVPTSPQEVLVRPDGKVAYVSCNLGGKVAAIAMPGAPSQWSVSIINAGKLADGLAWAQ